MEFNVEAIRKKAMHRILNDMVLVNKWNHNKTPDEDEVMITEQVIKIVAEYCVDEIYANLNDAYVAIKEIKNAIEQMDGE